MTDAGLATEPRTTNSGLIGDLANLCHPIAAAVLIALVFWRGPFEVEVVLYFLAPVASLVLGVWAVASGGLSRKSGTFALAILLIAAVSALPFGYLLLITSSGTWD